MGTILIDSDGANKSLDDVADKGEKTSHKLGQTLGKIGKVVGTATVSAIGAAATGLTALTKSALNAAGELEQNMGGAEAVFGEYAEQMVQTASTAYKNMGLSQSDFLATANKMGALFQGSGFGIEESANMSAQAMQRAADVASIMGIDVGAAMEAVAGAAKGNFTMMDNLGVAINDTTLQIYAQEKGLGKLETTQQKVNAAMQMFMEKTEYAAGNYAKENETLSGSLTTLKAAWDNWLSGAGNTDQLVDSVVGAADVIISNLESILPRLTDGISGLVSKLAPKIPTMIQKLLPSFTTGIITLVNSLGGQIGTILAIIIPILRDTIPEVLLSISTALIENLPLIIEAGIELTLALALGIAHALPDLIPTIIDAVIQIANAFISNIPAMIEAGMALLRGLSQGLWDELVALYSVIAEWFRENVITPISDTVTEFIQVGADVVDSIRQGISDAWGSLTTWFEGIWRNLFNRKAKFTVDANGASAEGWASGLEYVPYNNFPAMLHEGEAVLTASEAEAWRKGSGNGSGSGVTIIQNISATPTTPVQLASATAAYFEQARWAL